MKQIKAFLRGGETRHGESETVNAGGDHMEEPAEEAGLVP